MHYYPHHVGDYQRDTAHLSLVEHGAYRLLMDHYYVTERPLSGDLATLCRTIRAISKQEREAVATIAKTFFIVVDGLLVHKRIDAEIAEYARRSDLAANAGKKSGDARRAKRDALQNPNENRTTVERPLNDRSLSVAPPVELTSNQEPRTIIINQPIAGEPPTEAQALAYAENAGMAIAKDCVLRWLTDRDQANWTKPKGMLMIAVLPNWQADLRGYAMDWNKREGERKARQPTGGNGYAPKPRHAAYTRAGTLVGPDASEF